MRLRMCAYAAFGVLPTAGLRGTGGARFICVNNLLLRNQGAFRGWFSIISGVVRSFSKFA